MPGGLVPPHLHPLDQHAGAGRAEHQEVGHRPADRGGAAVHQAGDPDHDRVPGARLRRRQVKNNPRSNSVFSWEPALETRN